MMDAGTAMRQAHMTAHDYMLEAVKSIDEVFGKGYAEKNPNLVGDFMKTAAMDYAAAPIEGQELPAQLIADALDGIAAAIENK